MWNWNGRRKKSNKSKQQLLTTSHGQTSAHSVAKEKAAYLPLITLPSHCWAQRPVTLTLCKPTTCIYMGHLCTGKRQSCNWHSQVWTYYSAHQFCTGYLLQALKMNCFTRAIAQCSTKHYRNKEVTHFNISLPWTHCNNLPTQPWHKISPVDVDLWWKQGAAPCLQQGSNAADLRCHSGPVPLHPHKLRGAAVPPQHWATFCTQNAPSRKGPTGTIESNSRLRTPLPKIQTHRLKAYPNAASTWSHRLGSLCHGPITLQRTNPFLPLRLVKNLHLSPLP